MGIMKGGYGERNGYEDERWMGEKWVVSELRRETEFGGSGHEKLRNHCLQNHQNIFFSLCF